MGYKDTQRHAATNSGHESIKDALNRISDSLRHLRDSDVSSGSTVYERHGELISVRIPNTLTQDAKL